MKTRCFIIGLLLTTYLNGFSRHQTSAGCLPNAKGIDLSGLYIHAGRISAGSFNHENGLSLWNEIAVSKNEIPKRNMKDYVGSYTFIQGNVPVDSVLVKLHNDSVLVAEASNGWAYLKYVKEDEFELSEYNGQVLFLRNDTTRIVIGVKVVILTSDIEVEGIRTLPKAIE